MATREEIALLREARAGRVSQQLILGKYYLFGGAGLKRNPLSALHWLQRAASRDEAEAWLLIGRHIDFEMLRPVPEPMALCIWYERATDAGVVEASLTWARLELAHRAQRHGTPAPALPDKLLRALEQAAQAGVVAAQWLLAQALKRAADATGRAIDSAALKWATRAAANGVAQAQRALADYAWAQQDHAAFLGWALPVARALAATSGDTVGVQRLDEQDAAFLTRCAQALSENASRNLPQKAGADEQLRFWQLAAQAGDKQAQLALGMWFANMNHRCEREPASNRKSNYRKALQWLTLAGQQGVGKAWYALYKIFTRPDTNFSQADTAQAQPYLQRAAEAGECAAQLELGRRHARSARQKGVLDASAAYWLQKAAAQGDAEAQALLPGVAGRAVEAAWALQAQRQLTHEMLQTHPLLAARIKLAALFGLSLPEALLLDVNAADQGHCLLVDVRYLHSRCKPRLILVESAQERLALDQIGLQFAHFDCSVTGPEGNYRQRCYLANKLFAFLKTENRGAAVAGASSKRRPATASQAN
jgi:uncharacterized protein